MIVPGAGVMAGEGSTADLRGSSTPGLSGQEPGPNAIPSASHSDSPGPLSDLPAEWFACDCHGDPHMLFARCGGRLLCAKGWRAAGFPKADAAEPQRIHETETAVRERMTARGGKDRYMVRAGKS